MLLKPAWRSPTSLPSSTATAVSSWPSSSRASATRSDSSGSESERAVMLIIARPTITPTPATAATAMPIRVWLAGRCAAAVTPTSATPTSGTAEPKIHASMSL